MEIILLFSILIPNTGLRISNIEQTKMYDLLIIGGGINGTAIAADAAGRGLKVLLCEQNDLASATSSASSKLIHGGLRYLEHGDLHLVRQALNERAVLLYRAPHLVRPLQFIMPINKKIRSPWLVRIGLFLYDHLSNLANLAPSRTINLHKEFTNLFKEHIRHAFSFSDCWADDARLVIANALAAKACSAEIMNYTTFLSAKRTSSNWEAQLSHKKMGNYNVSARIIVNAAGPWVEEILTRRLNIVPKSPLSLVKGSHILVPRLYDGDYACLLQNDDRRICFVLPYHDHHLIGTTEVFFHSDISSISITEEEKNYLCNNINHYFRRSISSNDIIWSYAGVRALYGHNIANPSAISREYALVLDTLSDLAPLLSVYGGKITTHRKLAEQVLKKLSCYFPQMGAAWTETTPLPGGNIKQSSFDNFYLELKKIYQWLPAGLLKRYADQYGTRIHELLHNATTLSDLGNNFGSDLWECEINYLINNEWALTAEDILWRRTKVGLNFTAKQTQKLQEYLSNFI